MAERSTSTKYFVIALVIVAVIVAIYVGVQHHRAQPQMIAQQPMTAAEKNYLTEIDVVNPRMSAATNFLGDTVYYLEGDLVNKGSHTVREVDLSLSFMDPFGEVVLREAELPVTHQTAPLKPGEKRKLHLSFEQLPAEWNEGPPVITMSYISFR